MVKFCISMGNSKRTSSTCGNTNSRLIYYYIVQRYSSSFAQMVVKIRYNIDFNIVTQ